MIQPRDLLQWITNAAALLGYGAVCRYVDGYAGLAFLGLTAAAWFVHRRPERIPARWLLNSLATAVVVLSVLRVSPQYLVEPILEGILLLTGIKLLEARLPRDYLQIYALCVFELLGSALISLSMVFLLFFVPLAFLLTASLIILTCEAADPQMRLPAPAVKKILVQALLICLLSVPIMVVIFVVLPRTSYPILMFLNQSGRAQTGFSEHVQLGEVTSIQEDNSVVFRAAMASIAPQDLYWRGIVLEHFDGIEWRRGAGSRRPAGAVRVDGRRVRQTIYLEPYGNRFLFGLDKPVQVYRSSADRHADLSTEERHGIFQRIRYQVDSQIGPTLQAEGTDLAACLQLPPELPAEIRDLAVSLAPGASPRQQIQAFLRYLGAPPFRYTLSELPASNHPLTDFLLHHHQGNCEYFASSLAVLLRLVGVPARLVGGYKGGYYNAGGGYYLVLQKHAHIWTEAYLADLGWVRLDPTPAADLQPAELYRQRLLTRLRLLTDVLNYYWLRLIVDYDFQKQLHFVQQLRTVATAASWKPWLKHLPWVPILVLLSAAAVCTLLGWWLLHRYRRDPLHDLVVRFRARLDRHGYRMENHEGLEEFVARIDADELRRRALHFVLALEPHLYAGRPLAKTELRDLLRQLKEL